MSGPTLFQKGKLEAHSHSPKQAELDQHVPLDYIMDWFAKRLKSSKSPADRIMVLRSSTGSGKSTVIPPEFFHRFFEETRRRNIACTQPRVLTSIEIPKTILPFHSPEWLRKTNKSGRTPLIMGENIGFQNSVISKKPMRGIVYLTVGTLQQQLNIMDDESFMRKYSLIVIDEAHERSIGTDFTMYMMKKFINKNYKNPDCPFLLITSATFNTHKFADYLLTDVPKAERYANIIQVGGFTYPITETWMEYDSDNYIQDAVTKAVEIHKNNQDDFLPPSDVLGSRKSENKTSGNKKNLKITEDSLEDIKQQQIFRDILIFVSGEGDARKIIQKLNGMLSRDEGLRKYPFAAIKLMGVDVNKETDNYKNITKPLNKIGVELRGKSGKVSIVHPVRRIIVATNVAETGITIETLKYVIDTGYLKSSEFNPVYQTSMLVTRPVTQGMYTQRRGRSGRKAPGFAFPLYTKKTFESLQVDQYPDLIRDDTCLDLLGLIVKESDPEGLYNENPLVKLFADPAYTKKIDETSIDLYKLDLLDPPSADSLHSSVARLYKLGAITRACTPTRLGFIMNKFRMMSVESVKMILAGYAWGVSITDLITIAAFANSTDRPGFFARGARFGEDPFADAVNRGEFKFPWFLPNSERTKLMLSCDFIWGLLIWYNIQMLPPDVSLNTWCQDVGITFSGINEFIEKRDDIIQMMSAIGLNPYALFIKSFKYVETFELHDWLCSIKQCIFEGYKTNIAIWDDRRKKYRSTLGRLSFDADRSWISSGIELYNSNISNPKYLVYSGLKLRQDPRSNTYTVECGLISVLDGYVPFDGVF